MNAAEGTVVAALYSSCHDPLPPHQYILQTQTSTFSSNTSSTFLQLTYRLTTSPELALGIFSSTPAPSDPSKLPTYAAAHPADSTKPSQKAVLIAMIIATKTTTPVATDEAMQFAPEWRHHHHPQETQQQQHHDDETPTTTDPTPTDPPPPPPTSPDDPRGHKEHGRTICVWSLGVLPAYQSRGLGRTLMKSYQQRMETSGIADRIALLARGSVVGMYKGFGFEENGESQVQFAGGGWGDLVYEFAKDDGGAFS